MWRSELALTLDNFRLFRVEKTCPCFIIRSARWDENADPLFRALRAADRRALPCPGKQTHQAVVAASAEEAAVKSGGKKTRFG